MIKLLIGILAVPRTSSCRGVLHGSINKYYRGLKVATSFLKAGRCLLKADEGE